MSAAPETWYRYNEYQNEDGPVIQCQHFYVIKRTPKGVWVGWPQWKRFVLNDARKRFALPTKAEALQSYIARKRRQTRILASQYARARKALAMAREMTP